MRLKYIITKQKNLRNWERAEEYQIVTHKKALGEVNTIQQGNM